MKKTELDDRYVDLEKQLSLLADRGLPPLKRMTEAVALIRKALTELREMVVKDGFADEASEVNFFKRVKPRFYSLLILEMQFYQLEAGRPVGAQEVQQAYYREELVWIGRFFRQHAFHYAYYTMGATELDSLLFSRGQDGLGTPLPLLPEADPGFSTNGDYLFAQFRALELFRDHLLFLLEEKEATAEAAFLRPGRKHRELRWTGDTIHAVELAYGVWVSDHLNGGEAELADVVFWLSRSLHVDLSRYTRLFTEIKARKILSRTKFLDLLKDALTRYMDAGDAYKPVLRKAKRAGTV